MQIKFKHLITFLLMITFLCQNFFWAYGGPLSFSDKKTQDKLAKDTALDDPGFTQIVNGAAAIVKQGGSLRAVEKQLQPEEPPKPPLPDLGTVVSTLITFIITTLTVAFLWIIVPSNVNTTFADKPPAPDKQVSIPGTTKKPPWELALEKLLWVAKTNAGSNRGGIGLSYDSLGAIRMGGRADFLDGKLGVQVDTGLNNPLYGFGKQGSGAIGTVYWRPRERLWLSLRGGLLPDYSPDFTYLGTLSLDYNFKDLLHMYVTAGALHRELGGTEGSATGLLFAAGGDLTKDGFSLKLRASGPLYVKPVAETAEDYRRVVSDLASLMVRLRYERSFGRVSMWGGAEGQLGGMLSRDIPQSDFWSIIGDGGLRFDIGQFRLGAEGMVQWLKPSFTDQSTLMGGPLLSFSWRDLSLRGGVLFGPFTRPYGEVLYRIVRGELDVLLSGSYGAISPLYHPDFYTGPSTPRDEPLYGLSFNLSVNWGRPSIPSSSSVGQGNTLPVRTPTGIAMDSVLGPLAPLDVTLERQLDNATEEFETALRNAVQNAKTLDEILTIYRRLNELSTQTDYALKLTAYPVLWKSFSENPNVDFYWMTSLRKTLWKDKDIYEEWRINSGLKYNDMLKRLLEKDYGAYDFAAMNEFITEPDKLISAHQDELDINTVNGLFNLYITRLSKLPPNTPGYIFTCRVATGLYHILVKLNKTPGIYAFLKLHEVYLLIDTKYLGAIGDLPLPDRKMLAELGNNVETWITSDNLSDQIKGLVVIKLQLNNTTSVQVFTFNDVVTTRLYEISNVSIDKTPVDEKDENFLKLEAAAIALDILFQINRISETDEEVEKFIRIYKSLSTALKERLKFDKLREPLEKADQQSMLVPTGSPIIGKLAGVVLKTSASILAGLLLSGCSGNSSSIGALVAIVILVVLMILISTRETTTHGKIAKGLKRRTFLAWLGLGFAGCVIDNSGFSGRLPDAGTADMAVRGDMADQTDAAVQEINVDATFAGAEDRERDGVTILPDSKSLNGNAAISPDPLFVRDHNAAFTYSLPQGQTSIEWDLQPSDSNIIKNSGLNFVYKGADSVKFVRLLVNDGNKTLLLILRIIPITPDMSMPDKDPYRIQISWSHIDQFVISAGLNQNTAKITKITLETQGTDLTLNGIRQSPYVVEPSQGNITPDYISPGQYTAVSGGAMITSTPTPDGVKIDFSIESGNADHSASVVIPAIYGGIDTKDPAVQGAWQMNGNMPGIDSSDKGNTLTANGNVTLVGGRHGQAVHLDGQQASYLEIPDNKQNGLDITGDITLSCWVNPDDLLDYSPVISKWAPNGQFSYELAINNTGTLNFALSSNGTDISGGEILGAKIIPGKWRHIAAVLKGNSMRVYLDGKDVGGFPYNPRQIFNGTAPFRIGSHATDALYYNGYIDEAAVYNKALTPAEILSLYQQVNSSNFTTPNTTRSLEIKGNSPFILRLTDNIGTKLDVLVLGLDPVNPKSIVIDSDKVRVARGSLIDLTHIVTAEFLFDGQLVPGPTGQKFDGTITVKGALGMPKGTRLEYATDDPDLSKNERKLLTQSLANATHTPITPPESITLPNGYTIHGVTKWPNTLTPLGFTINGKTFSAFFIGKDIYIPHPNLLNQIIEGYPALLSTAKRRLTIILNHEIDEATGTKDHSEVVLNEFEKNSINGLNFADVATILFRTISEGYDGTFHERFIRALLTQGMGLFLTADTYYEIIRFMLDPGIAEDTIKPIYDGIIKKLNGIVNAHISGREFAFDSSGFNVGFENFEDEAGFARLIGLAEEEKPKTGTIQIDLNRFFIPNTSLSSAVTIDTEYLKRFIAFSKMLPEGVKITGLTEKPEKDIVIGQLLAIINSQLPGRVNTQYSINYATHPFDTNAVMIATGDTLNKIPDTQRSQLKIVVPQLGINRVTDVGYEFSAAWQGLDKNRDEFVNLILQIARELIVSMKIPDGEALLAEIRKDGIGFMPTWLDPIQYYKNIQAQKSLLIAA